MKVEAQVECPVFTSFRVQQVAGIFDLSVANKSRASFIADVPGPEEDWSIGLIVGPSGSGKSTIARQAFGEQLYQGGEWPSDRAVVDCFGETASIKEITHVLTSVGFSSPPSWVKPYSVLSNGEKFRCDLARSLMGEQPTVVFDEFTSVVDRTVAKIGSAAVAKAIRSGRIKRRFVAVACHYDIAEWLEPDWVLDMSTQTLARGRLRRPEIRLEIKRVDHRAWKLFEKHHYLTASLNHSAACFVAFVDGQPAAFDAWLPFVGKLRDSRKARRGHRTVCLPDFQGVGIGAALFNSNARMWAGLGYRVFSCTAHPAEIRSRIKRHDLWRMTRPPGRTSKDTGRQLSMRSSRASGRNTASFEWVGPRMDSIEAARCLNG
jgi:ABC-type Mn2+/Zn2+ transport system ATPase subunit